MRASFAWALPVWSVWGALACGVVSSEDLDNCDLTVCTAAPPLDWSDELTVGTEPDPVAPDTPEVTFVVLGDFGAATDAQARTAARIGAACEVEGCDFTLLLGDNLYSHGLDGSAAAEDELRAFVDSYPDIPAYATLGNHDWNSGDTDLLRAQRELRWIAEQDDVFGQFHFYDFAAGPVRFWVADTTWMVRHPAALLSPGLHEWSAGIEASSSPWTIVLGHHPLLSNGRHGNAGSFVDSGGSVWPGENLRDWAGQYVAGNAALHLAGHDHNLNFFPTLGAGQAELSTASLVSGAAAKCRPAEIIGKNPGESGATASYEYYGYGFAIVRASADELTVRIYREGEPAWVTRRTRASSTWTIDTGGPFIDRSDNCD